MNRTEQQTAERIRSQYAEKPRTELDELRELDRRVKRPARLFAYLFGGVSALIMGSGMSLVMTSVGEAIGMANATVPGIVIGAVGMVMALVTYPAYKSILGSRKRRYASEILALGDRIEGL